MQLETGKEQGAVRGNTVSMVMAAMIVSAGVSFSPPAVAAQMAGGQITNTATILFNQSEKSLAVDSNAVAVRLDERLDVTVAPATPLTTTAGATNQSLSYQVTNTGNGPQTFELQASVIGGGFTPVVTRITASGANGGPLTTAVGMTAESPVLAPGQSVSVIVTSDLPAGSTGSSTVRLTATSETGHGSVGLVFAGQGASGGDAVVGKTGAQAFADGVYLIGAPPVQLIKSQSVADADGGSRAVAGSVISYTLDAKFQGAGPFANARLSDAIPAGSTYVPGSIKLDGAALSDAAAFNVGSVNVALGDVTGPAEHVLTFQVTINAIRSTS